MLRTQLIRQERPMPFQRLSSYDGATLSAMRQAYDEACRDAGLKQTPSGDLGDPKRDALAKSIATLAATGERNPAVLTAYALWAFGNLK
jgi:hypothetical protein